MRDLLNTLGKTLLDVGNFGMLLVLFMYIYALVGLQFFANRFHFNSDGVAVGIGEEGYYSAQVPRSNFDTLMNAFTTIFEVSWRGWHWPCGVKLYLFQMCASIIDANNVLQIQHRV